MFVASIDKGAQWVPVAQAITLGELRLKVLARQFPDGTELLIESDSDYYCSATLHNGRFTLVWG